MLGFLGRGQHLERYLCGQLYGFLLISITMVTLIVFFSDTLFDFIKEMQDLGLSLDLAVEFLLLQVPNAFVFAFAPSVFLTVLMVYSQLNKQFELVAMRMNGISLWRIFSPVLGVGLMVAILSGFASEIWIPTSQLRLDVLREEVITSSQLKLTKDGITLPIFKDGQWDRLIHAEHASLNNLEGFTFIQREKSGGFQVIQASQAQYTGQAWNLNGVRLFSYLPDQNRFVVNAMGQVQKRELLEVDQDLLQKSNLKFHHSKVSFGGLRRHIEAETAAGNEVPPKLYTMLWERFGQPLNCLALAFMAFPLAITPPRQSGAKGLIYAVATLFILYVSRAVFISLGQGGLLTFGGFLPFETSIALACLLPGVVMILLGAWLIHRKSFRV
jgi:lipopolysaccharide export LptBFGC system permease protein LptF